MEIDRLTISNFRGIKGEFQIEPEGENVVLVGPNGSGKSSVISAIDFLLTGTIEGLSGPGTQSITERRHGPHIDTNPDDSWVEAVFSDGEDSVTIKRILDNRNELFIEGGSETLQNQLDSVSSAAERGLHLLSRDEILDFITAKGGTRSERIRTLLNLQKVKSRRLALENAADYFDEQASVLEREADSNRKNSYRALDIEPGSESSIQGRVNELRAELGGEKITNPGFTPMVSGIESPSERVVASPLLRSDGRQRVEELRNWLEEGLKKFIKADAEIRDRWEELEADEEVIAALERQRLIELGRDAINSDAERCPLCLEPWNPDHLKKHLEERLEHASELQEELGKLEEVRDNAQQILTDIRIISQSLRETLKDIKRFDGEKLETYITVIQEWEKGYGGDLLSSPPNSGLTDDERRELLRPPGLLTLIAELQEYVEEGPQLDQLEESWQALNATNTRYKEMIESSRQSAGYRRVADDMKVVHGRFIEARDTVLNGIYSGIEDQLEEYYTTLHADELEFNVGLEPKERRLDLEVEFYGRGQYPPHALHSEGHQDSMGICLYFALCNWLQEQEELPLMMLDDVVMSIDADHRRPLAKLMASDLAGEYQLFVATHDDLWHRHLRSTGVVSSKNAIQFAGWNIEDGPLIHGRPEMEWGTIEVELEAENVSIAAHQTRRMAEWFLREACDNLEAKVPFKSDSRWNLGDFKSGVESKYKKLIRQSKDAENSWGRDTSGLEDLEDRAAETFKMIDEDGPALNPNIHWNETENAFAHCTSDELRPAVRAYRNLYELLWCQECNSCVSVVKDGKKKVGLRCKCSNFDLNLRRA